MVILLPFLVCFIIYPTSAIPGVDEEDPRDGIRAPKPYYIVEQLAKGTPVGNVLIDARLSQRYTPEELAEISYHFISQRDENGVDVPLFEIDSHNGIITTAKVIDRDVLCAKQIQCLINLLVGLSPSQYFQEIRIIVDIIDLNDNAPYFPDSEIMRQISESASLSGARITIPAAVDPDSPTYSVQKYELISSSDRFHIDDTNPDTGLRIQVRPLDHETINSYQFRVIAYDGGNPPKSGSILVDIEVLDSNDNEPLFDDATFEIFVLETVEANTTIGRVAAIDKDIGSKITYHFSEGTIKQYGHLFGIEPYSGSIYLKKSLDFEQGSMYILSLVATDGTSQAFASATVRVEDSNDNAPVISINTLTPNGIAQISESADVGTFVAHVAATDMDGGDNGRLECSLDNGAFELELITHGQYKILTASELNREMQPIYNAHVICHDMGVQRRTSSAALTVQVLDSNDHSPIFTTPIYQASLRENNYIDDFVIRVHAVDADESLNGQVTYSLHSDALNLFKIDAKKGDITANAIFDRETMGELTFHVTAHDNGAPRRSSSATVHVKILDVNDEAPTFEQNRYNFGIYENEEPGQKIGEVSASDHDADGNNEFTYQIIKSSAGAATEEAFEIDSQTGMLKTKAILDRETEPVYYLTVRVESKRGIFPHTSSTASVTVYVADKNDNSPVIDWPTLYNNSVQIPSNLRSGDMVAHIHAHDVDIGDNGKVLYVLNDDSDSKDILFRINSVSGVITLQKDIDETMIGTHHLDINVHDRGYPQRHTETQVIISVNKTSEIDDNQQRIIITNHNTIIIISLTSAFLILIFLIVLVVFVLKKTLHEYQKPIRTHTNSHMLCVRDENSASPSESTVEASTSYQIKPAYNDLNEIEIDISPHNKAIKRTNLQNGPKMDKYSHANRLDGNQPEFCADENEWNASKQRFHLQV